MFSRAKQLLLLFLLLLCAVDTMAQQRRPVDAQHPLWLVHVDVWNQADPRKIIALIPDDIKPYVCMNLSLSCSYDVDQDVYMRPQNYLRTYKSFTTAKRTFDKLHFKGVDLAILEVNNGESVEDGKEVFRKHT